MVNSREGQIKRTLLALENNGFVPHFFETAQAASAWLIDELKNCNRVGFGGSVTLRELDVPQQLRELGVETLDHWEGDLSPVEKRRQMLSCFDSDAYCCSANALLEQGWIFNSDGRGNRVAACCFGPEKLYIVAGVNKLVDGVAAAEERLKKVAGPLNACKNKSEPPCAVGGECVDCGSDDRICRVYVLMKRPPRDMQVHVVIVGEKLGF